MNLSLAVSIILLDALIGSESVNELLGIIWSPHFYSRLSSTQANHLERCGIICNRIVKKIQAHLICIHYDKEVLSFIYSLCRSLDQKIPIEFIIMASFPGSHIFSSLVIYNILILCLNITSYRNVYHVKITS